jgi:hypothetical protein
MRMFDLEPDGSDLFVTMDGKRVAKRGRPGTPQAGTWISLEPGIVVGGTVEQIAVEISGVRVH